LDASFARCRWRDLADHAYEIGGALDTQHIVTKTFDLGSTFTFRVPRLYFGLVVDSFTGTPANVVIHTNADPSDLAGADMVRQLRQVLKATPTQFYIVNKVAAAGKTLTVRYLTKFEQADPGSQLGQLVNTDGSAIDPATEDKQDDLIATIGEVQESPTQYTLLDRLKSIWSSIGEVQESPTQYTLLDRLKSIWRGVARVTTPTIYHVTITDADAEYTQALPANTKKFAIHLQDYSGFRLAFETGKVAAPTAPYLTYPSGCEYFLDGADLTDNTIYIAAPAASKVAEIEVWT